jgi:hypothetical protein
MRTPTKQYLEKTLNMGNPDILKKSKTWLQPNCLSGPFLSIPILAPAPAMWRQFHTTWRHRLTKRPQTVGTTASCMPAFPKIVKFWKRAPALCSCPRKVSTRCPHLSNRSFLWRILFLNFFGSRNTQHIFYSIHDIREYFTTLRAMLSSPSYSLNGNSLLDWDLKGDSPCHSIRCSLYSWFWVDSSYWSEQLFAESLIKRMMAISWFRWRSARARGHFYLGWNW